MKRIDDAFERLLAVVSERATGRGISVLAVALYAGLGLVVPIVLGLPLAWFVLLNVMGTMFASVFLLGWLVARVQEGHRRRLLEWTSDLRLLDAQEFEWLVGEVYRREGWKVEESGSQDGPDGNIDLRLTRAHERAIVQCKRWTSWRVGVEEIRAFGGTLMREGLPGSAGVFVTLSTFTVHALAEAKSLGIALVDSRDLALRIEKVRQAEPCPKCSAGMVLDRSARGWWLRCVAKGRDGKRDLGADPARAAEMLIKVA